MFFPELHLKMNPIIDRRLSKLIDQCRTKQVLDYVKQHCPKTASNQENGEQKGKSRKKKQSEVEDYDLSIEYKYSINIKPADEEFKVCSFY